MPQTATTLHRGEAERLKALLQYGVLDSPSDPSLNEIAALAAQITHAPYAYVGFLDANRLFFKSRVGFSEREQPREACACQYTILDSQPLLIQDTAKDSRFAAGAICLSEEIRCRSYMAVPLISPAGIVVGTLAVLSTEPGAFDQGDVPALEILARQIVTRLEYYISIRHQERTVRARQRIERALTVERNFVSAVLDTVSALVLVLDTAGRIVRFNPACERISGYSSAELVGRPFPEELFLDEERDRAHALFRSARSGAPTEPYEMHWVARDGKRHLIAWTATTLADAMGEVSFVITTGVDVTEQREAEAALRSSEARYRQLVEGSLGMVCTHDLEGNLLSINTHAAENLGYKPEELIGQSMYGHIQDDHKHGWDSYWRAMAEHGEDQGLLYLKKKDGSPCVIAFRNKLLNLPGTPPFVLGHGIDITEKTDAENKLHALMRQRESILESVGDGIYGMDMEGCILFVNRVGAHMLGFEPEELEGREIHPLIHHSRADGTPYPWEDCPIQKTRHRHTAIRVLDEVFWRKDGTYIPVEYVACPLVANGNITGVVVAFQDVTERRRLDRMKDEFISTVSHELRTPLTSLRAALGLIAGGKLDQRPEKAGQMFEVAMANCDRLVRLVNDILDFERISNDKLRLERTEINAVDLLRRVAELQHSSAQNAGLKVLVDAEPVELWVDNDRLVQTLTNLLSNAIKFSPPGSEIKLLARPLNESEALIEVRDEGRGIPAEKLDMIFERFQQVDASDSRDMGGTGLGLAICRSIVRQHGGRIWAESTVGKGSSFFLSLPRHVATAAVHDAIS